MAGVGCDQSANGDYKTFKDLQEEDDSESVTESSDAGESNEVLPEQTADVLPESTDVPDDPASRRSNRICRCGPAFELRGFD